LLAYLDVPHSSVRAAGHLQHVPAVHVGVDDLALQFDGHAGERNPAGLVAGDGGDAHRLHPLGRLGGRRWPADAGAAATGQTLAKQTLPTMLRSLMAVLDWLSGK
jgi:hypothetical protein